MSNHLCFSGVNLGGLKKVTPYTIFFIDVKREKLG